ncbi:GNAT family N-acetyltransferase [Candidatus Bathyarchaeota archaeon]|nr:GNAT family N-acetyltransferase [Candidatus Bathyarchaeota archaeon]
MEDVSRSVCHKKVEGNAMLWDIGVLKEYRRKGVASKFLSEGISQAKKHSVKRSEAWSIEEGAKEFYTKFGFTKFIEYYHVLIDKREKLRPFDKDGMHITELYAHVMPDTDINDITRKYVPKEVHICAGFELSV